jgi:hypothetical protein
MIPKRIRLTLRTAALVSTAVLGTIACGADTPVGVPPPPPAVPPPPPPPPPGAGSLTVTFATPNTDDGAILLELRGPNIQALAAANQGWHFSSDASGTTVRGVVAGNLTPGAVLTFRVPDVGAAASYTATLVDVADRQNRLRSALTGYALTVGP